MRLLLTSQHSSAPIIDFPLFWANLHLDSEALSSLGLRICSDSVKSWTTQPNIYIYHIGYQNRGQAFTAKTIFSKINNKCKIANLTYGSGFFLNTIYIQQQTHLDSSCESAPLIDEVAPRENTSQDTSTHCTHFYSYRHELTQRLTNNLIGIPIHSFFFHQVELSS